MPEWGTVVRGLTGGEGVDHVVEVGGAATMKQSVVSVKIEGIISVIGAVGGESADVPNLISCWAGLFVARGIYVGSRRLLEEMCQAMAGNLDQLRPLLTRRFLKPGTYTP